MKSAKEWFDMRKEINDLHGLLLQKPDSERMGYIISPGGILNAYREADISFDIAVKQIESLILADRAEVRRDVVEEVIKFIEQFNTESKDGDFWTV